VFRDARPTLSGLLAGAALGVYLLVLSGATAALADAARACGAWPACGGVGLTDPGVAVALGHRVAVALVGALLLWTLVAAVRRGADRRVLAALGAGVALYPLQVGVGAVAALSGATDPLPAVHLGAGVAIFGATTLALAWHLETETADLPDPLAAEEGDHGAGGGHPDPADDEVVPGGDLPDPLPDGPLGTVRAYVRLTKPRLMWLLCLVAAAALALAAADGRVVTARTVALTLGGGVLAIGASGTFNHVLERDVDRRMARTADRAPVIDRVGVGHATAFGLALAAASLALFWATTPLAAALGAVAIAFYSVVYTLVLKPNTVQNTVVGGFAGSLPALIAWAAVTGGLAAPAWALAGLIFLWTPAHFYNLAMAHREDYARGGFPMLPVVAGPAVARKHVLYYLGATLVAAAALPALTPLGPAYAAAVVALGALFLWTVVRLHRERTEAAAMRAFHASNAFLGGTLLVVVLDALLL
jgi:protoheme IX farnesyltransferase